MRVYVDAITRARRQIVLIIAGAAAAGEGVGVRSGGRGGGMEGLNACMSRRELMINTVRCASDTDTDSRSVKFYCLMSAVTS